MQDFPESYQGYLIELQNKHPNWTFTPLYTNLDWNTVINEENIFGRNLVPKNYSKSWKNTNPNEYNLEIDRGWVDSSRRAVEYCMDPRNFLNEIRIFQFEGLSYNSSTNSLEGIEKILYGTEFYNKKVSYIDSIGNTINMNEKYSDLILKAGQISRVSPYHLASRIKQEVGPFLTHSSISGTVGGYEGLYNFYNIGATSSPEPMGAIKKGLQYAKDGKGASEQIKSKYFIPWNTKEKAITGGAIFIGSSYINVGQNTIYLQKFHVNPDSNIGLFWHQYMTNVLAPYSESKSIYNGYSKSGLINTSMSFIIPVFNNMPEIPKQNPDINLNDFSSDNSRVTCNSADVNIRTGPSTSYEIITSVSNPEKMLRIKLGNQSGDKWDMVKLDNGIVGYIFQKYVKVGFLYGDVNGDGKITSVDLLVLQRYILGLENLDERSKKAGNTSKNGNNPTSVDLLVIQRHILGLELIDNSEEEVVYRMKAPRAIEEERVNANLEVLAIENELLEPNFEPDVTKYKLEVSNEVTRLNIFAVPEKEDSKIEIKGAYSLDVRK